MLLQTAKYSQTLGKSAKWWPESRNGGRGWGFKELRGFLTNEMHECIICNFDLSLMHRDKSRKYPTDEKNTDS
jgi:hypothetical protein